MKKVLLSDIHSNIKALNLLKKTKYWDNDEYEIWFGGDYIDGFNQRQNEGLDVLNFVMDSVNNHNSKAILGNHEDFLLKTLKRNIETYKLWKFNGGKHTLSLSFGITDTRIDSVIYNLETNFHNICEFIKHLPLTIEDGNVIMVHAGYDLSKNIKDQSYYDMLWARSEYYKYDDCIDESYQNKIIVSGHTPTQLILPFNNCNIIKDYGTTKSNLIRYYIDGGSKSYNEDYWVNSKINALVLGDDGEYIDSFELWEGGEIVQTNTIKLNKLNKIERENL